MITLHPSKHQQSISARQLIWICLWILLLDGCASAAPVVSTSQPVERRCFADSVFTAEQMQARVDCHPSLYKMQLTTETVVLFAFPDPIIDWAGPIFIIHIPSVSEVVLDNDTAIITQHYQTEEGKAAIQDVLGDQHRMEQIRIRARMLAQQSVAPLN